MPNLRARPVGDNWVEVGQNTRFTGELDYPGGYPWNTYYVDYNQSSNNKDGTTPEKAFKTIAYAVSKAEPWDTIRVLPDYDCTAMEEGADMPVEITQDGLKILGSLSSERQWGSPAFHSHGTDSMFYINAHQVEIGHLAFHMQGAAPAMIEVAQNGNYWRTHIHDCYFGGNGLALCGIVAGNVTGSGFGYGATVDAPCTTIERCYFNFINGSCVYAYCGYGSVIRDSSFFVQAGDVGISVGNETSSRPHLEILDNRFSTPDSTNAIGIDVVNTPDAGYLFIDGNRFVNFASDDKCCTKRTGYMGLNYAGVTAVTITT